MTLDIVLKVLITSVLGYIALNTLLRYHFSLERNLALFMGLLFVTSIIYLDTNLLFEFGLTVGIIFVLCFILKLISLKQKKHGYFLLNTYRCQYNDVFKDITEIVVESEVVLKNINYNQKTPFLVVLKDVKLKKANDFMKELDKRHSQKPKKFTMYNYWFIVGFLISMVILWRF